MDSYVVKQAIFDGLREQVMALQSLDEDIAILTESIRMQVRVQLVMSLIEGKSLIDSNFNEDFLQGKTDRETYLRHLYEVADEILFAGGYDVS